MPTTTHRPPTRLAKLEKSLAKAVPKGLPAALKRFYAAGDGLEVSLPDGRTECIVGVAGMFDGRFVPAPQFKTPPRRWGRYAFDERFFTQDVEADTPEGLAKLNLLVRLKLVADIEGTSDAIAIDIANPKAPVLYYADRAYAAHELDLSFDDFVRYFSKYGAHGWPLAFLTPAALVAMNIEISGTVADALALFSDGDVVKLEARTAKLTAAAKRLRDKHAAAAAKAETKAAAKALRAAKAGTKSPASLGEHARLFATLIPEAIRDADKKDLGHLYRDPARLQEPGAWDRFVEAVDAGAVTLTQAWAVSELVEHLPERYFVPLLVAKRDTAKDTLWRRVDQLFRAGFVYKDDYARLKLDPLMTRVLDVFRALDTGTAKDAKSIRVAVGELAIAPPFFVAARGYAPWDPETTEHLDWQRGQLRGLANALLGEPAGMQALHATLAKLLTKKQVSYVAVAAAGPLWTLDDVPRLRTGARDALGSITRENNWSAAQLKA